MGFSAGSPVADTEPAFRVERSTVFPPVVCSSVTTPSSATSLAG